MAFESGRACPNCGTQLTEYENNEIENGRIIRCRGCSLIVSREGAYDGGVSSGPTVSGTYFDSYTPGPYSKSGGIGPMGTFFIGFIILSIGLYSWIFYIPLFSDFFFGEIIGGLVVVVGLRGLWSEASDPSGVWMIMGGLALWILAWLSWMTYIPVLSDFFFGEIGSLLLFYLGYQKLKK